MRSILLLALLCLSFLILILISHQEQTRLQASTVACSKQRTCTQCLNQTLPSSDEKQQVCIWCTQTSTCIDSVTHTCHNASQIFFIGDEGGGSSSNRKKSKDNPFYLIQIQQEQQLEEEEFNALNKNHNGSSPLKKTYAEMYPVDEGDVNPAQTAILDQCATQYTRLEQCLMGMEYAQIYLPVSKSVRNLQEGGLMVQPILPLTQSFLNHYISLNNSVSLNDNDSSNDEKYLEAVLKDYIVTVGAYFINPPKALSKYKPRLFSFFHQLGSQHLRANITLSSNSKMKVTAVGNGGQLIWNWYSSDMGIVASPNHYKIGMIIAMYNRTSKQPICMHYQIPDKIRARTVYFEMLIGPHLGLGVPLFVASFITLVVFIFKCPFAKSNGMTSDANWEKVSRELEDDIIREEGEHSGTDVERLLSERQVLDLKWFATLNSTKMIRQCGFPAYYWWKFHRRIVLMIGLFAFITFPTLLPIHVVYNRNQQYYPDFSITTFGKILDGSKVSAAHFTMNTIYYVVCVINMALTVKLLIFKRRREKLSSVTLRVSNLPPLQISIERNRYVDLGVSNPDDIERREQLLCDHFNSIVRNVSSVNTLSNPLEEEFISSENSIEDAVLCATITPDMHLISSLFKQYEDLKVQLSDSTLSEQTKIADKIEKTRDKILAITQRNPVVSTSAFVTFRSAKYLDTCVKAHSPKSRDNMADTVHSLRISALGSKNWNIHQCTWEPEDIEWDNLHHSRNENLVRTIISYVATSTFVLVSVGLLCIYIVLNGMYGAASRIQLRQSKWTVLANSLDRRWITQLANIPYYVLPIFLAILNEIFALIFYYFGKAEKMKTKSRFEASYLLKTALMCTFSSLLTPYYGDLQMRDTSPKSFYNNSGLKLMYLLLSQMFVSKGLVLFMDVVTIAVRNWKTSGAPERPKFNFVSSYSISLYIFYTLTALGTRFPMLFIPGVMFFVMNYFVDTFLICFLYDKATGVGSVEFGIASLLTLLFASLAVVTSPAYSRVISQVSSTSFFFVTCAALLMATLLISRYIMRKHKERLCVEEEKKYMNRYTHPQLTRLLQGE